MSQFNNTPQSFFYGINRTIVNTALAGNAVAQRLQPTPYYTGGYTVPLISPLRFNPMVASVAPEATSPGSLASFYRENRLTFTSG